MPVVGFIDDAGERVRFDAIRRGKGTFALPRPMILAFASGYRAADHYGDASVISVTTLINPTRQTRLKQRHEFFVKPLSSWQATFGTMGHAILDAAAVQDHEKTITERRLVIERGGQLVGGTFDLLECEDGDWIGRDYKITSAYGVAKMKLEGVRKSKPEYYKQANLYRLMIADAAAREVLPVSEADARIAPELVPFSHAGLKVKRWELVLWSRDYKADRGKDYMTVTPYPINQAVRLAPIEVVPVRLGSSAGVEQYLTERLVEYAATDLCDDDGLPNCTAKETWNGRRCAQWCEAAGVCGQYAKRLRS